MRRPWVEEGFPKALTVRLEREAAGGLAWPCGPLSLGTPPPKPQAKVPPSGQGLQGPARGLL